VGSGCPGWRYPAVTCTTRWVTAALLGVGFGVGYAALGTLAVQHVPLDSSAIASGINSLVRTAGGSVGPAVTASILASNTIHGTTVPTRHGYVILAVGAGLSAVAALYYGLRYGSRASAA
jgi:hypothetical protein